MASASDWRPEALAASGSRADNDTLKLKPEVSSIADSDGVKADLKSFHPIMKHLLTGLIAIDPARAAALCG